MNAGEVRQTHTQCSMNQVQLDLTTRSVACLSPSLGTFIHFTYKATVHLWYPAQTTYLAGSYDLSGKGTEDMNVRSYLYKVTWQLRILSFLTWCLIAELCHAVGCEMQASLGNAWRGRTLDGLKPLWAERERRASANAWSCTYKLSRL